MDMTAHPRSEQATLRYLADARQVHDYLRATLTQIIRMASPDAADPARIHGR